MSHLLNLKMFFTRKVLRQQTLEKALPYFKIFAILIALAAVGFSAKSVTQTQEKFALKLDQFNLSNKSADEAQPSLGTQRLPENLSIPLEKLLGPIGVATPDAGKSTPTESSLPLSLIGVFLPEGDSPYAIIQDDKKSTQEVFGLGDSIFDAAKLIQIYPEKVEIDRNGSREILIIDSNSKSAPSSTGSSSEGEFTVDEKELDQALENLPLLLTQARAVPYFKDGKAVGLRMFAIRTGSLFEKIGLQNGDVLKSVNGNSLADLSQAMQLFQKLKEERSIDLVLERNTAEKTFKYQIN
jgi:type II secretion system protein C